MLEDADGREYLDFMAGVGVASLGHSHPRWTSAISAQASKLSVGSFASETRLALLKLLASILPESLHRVQLYSGGSEAVEAALRLAKAHTEKFENLFEAGVIDPTKVARIALENAASVAGMILTTECALTEIKEDAPAGPPMGGGGMPGMM